MRVGEGGVRGEKNKREQSLNSEPLNVKDFLLTIIITEVCAAALSTGPTKHKPQTLSKSESKKVLMVKGTDLKIHNSTVAIHHCGEVHVRSANLRAAFTPIAPTACPDCLSFYILCYLS